MSASLANYQPGVLELVPAHASMRTWRFRHDVDVHAALARVAAIPVTQDLVLGIGEPFVLALGRSIPGLRTFPSLSGPGVAVAATQAALWTYVRGESDVAVTSGAQALLGQLSDFIVADEDVDAFRHDTGRDLTGYEDGTENPVEDAAVEAAIVARKGPGLDGASFVAVQRWVHDLDGFAARLPAERDHIIGRSVTTNEELEDAPPSAHVKRAAQESFDPEAFMVRRSMAYRRPTEAGLYFIAFGESLDRFERVMRRMLGLEDGIVDGLFRFTHSRSGGYYWCPPVRDGHLDLSVLSVRG